MEIYPWASVIVCPLASMILPEICASLFVIIKFASAVPADTTVTYLGD